MKQIKRKRILLLKITLKNKQFKQIVYLTNFPIFISINRSQKDIKNLYVKRFGYH